MTAGSRRRKAHGSAHLRLAARPARARGLAVPFAVLLRKAHGSAHLRLVVRSAHARGLVVRVRLANCIPHLRRSALRACSAGGIAVFLPSSGCDGALTRPGNKECMRLCTRHRSYNALRSRCGMQFPRRTRTAKPQARATRAARRRCADPCALRRRDPAVKESSTLRVQRPALGQHITDPARWNLFLL